MKAADIPDAEVFAAIARVCAIRGGALDIDGARWMASRWDIGEQLGGQFPEKVVLAKLKSMCRRYLLTGCPCGCRGDFQIVGNASSQS